ncbi:MAG: FkbM family methyltransferase [Solirubrobacterales bacterium]|nr:FkbM family methyltransferase [Solirubrobacterales bacterium]
MSRLHPGMRSLQHRLSAPARRAALPVLRGNGRGLRVRVGGSIMRVAGRGEPQVEQAYLELLRPGDVVYDVGANIGWYSLLAARVVGPAGRVLAFEPSLENALFAQQNAAVNGLDNITVVPAALTDRDGWMTFLQGGSVEGRLEKDDSAAQAERRASRNMRFEGRTQVPVTTLDSWLAQTGEPPPSVVKIDVEGAEVGVLRGMEQTLRGAGPTLIIELHGTRDEVADQLDHSGYEHFTIERDVPTRQAPWWAHVLARPSSS